MKRPHILDMDRAGLGTFCGLLETIPRVGMFVAVSRAEHERHPERTCEACRAAYEGRK